MSAINPDAAAQIRGEVDPTTVGQADHAITAEERQLALDVAGALALEHGLDLAAAVAAHRDRVAAVDAAAERYEDTP